MRLIYASLLELRLRVGIVDFWGSASCTTLARVLRSQKRAICAPVIAGMNKISSLTYFFQPFEIWTLPSLRIYKIILFYKFKSTLIKTGSDLHTYETDLSQLHFRKTFGRKCFEMFSKKYKIIKIDNVLFNKEFTTLSMNSLDATSILHCNCVHAVL